MANRARNDIQESLRDLGKNTVYRAGQPIDPGVEATNDPNCTPLPGWRFTLGTGYQTRAVSGPWGSLSIVTDPYDTDIVTEARVRLRDYAGRPTDDFLEGATTIELTKAQAIRAAIANRLWIQGGTPSDPILNGPYPGQFGFGALRCSVDNLNGDNVEWIAYPQGTEHVFCYAYYVRPPPTSGTIVIRKEVRGTPGATQTFTFDGNLSFNEGNLFNLRVSNGQPASQSFYRAATGATDGPWVVHERVPGGWRLAELSCSSTAGSTVATDLAAARAEIRLAPGDTVTCTYVNEVRPPAGELFIRKLTRGGIGSFDFDVMRVGGGAGAKAHAETKKESVAVDAQPSPLTLSPGTYRIDEQLPESRAGEWRLDNVICGGLPAAASESTEVTITDGGGATCTFENSFVPSGKIAIDKVTLGGVTTTGFVISPVGDPDTQYRKAATTSEPGVAVRAEGSNTNALPLGAYVIQELEPASDADSDWSLIQVVCNGHLVPAVEGRVVVTLTRDHPRRLCRFTNTKRATPIPPEPGPRTGARPRPESCSQPAGAGWSDSRPGRHQARGPLDGDQGRDRHIPPDRDEQRRSHGRGDNRGRPARRRGSRRVQQRPRATLPQGANPLLPNQGCCGPARALPPSCDCAFCERGASPIRRRRSQALLSPRTETTAPRRGCAYAASRPSASRWPRPLPSPTHEQPASDRVELLDSVARSAAPPCRWRPGSDMLRACGWQ